MSVWALRSAMLGVLGWGALPAAAGAEAPVLQVRSSDHVGPEGHPVGEILPQSAELPGGGLRVDTGPDGPHTLHLLALEAPPVEGPRWRLEGRIRYRDVEGEGHLTLLSDLPSGTFFTKSVAMRGPLGKVTGSSHWRRFSLPFDAGDTGEKPDRLRLDLFLPGRAHVELGDVVLYPAFDDALVEDLGPRFGWNSPTLGFAAGMVGSLYGFIGALIGLMRAQRRGSRASWFLVHSMAGVAIVAVLVGLVAIATGQGGGWLIGIGCLGGVLYVGLTSALRKADRLDGPTPPAT